MNNRRYRHRLLALSASILLGLSSLSSSAVDAQKLLFWLNQRQDTTVSQDTGNPSADTKEAAEGQTEGETTEPERIEPDAYFEPIQSNDTANWPQGPAVWVESSRCHGSGQRDFPLFQKHGCRKVSGQYH